MWLVGLGHAARRLRSGWNSASDLFGFIFGIDFPALDNPIAINRVVLADAREAPGVPGGDKGEPLPPNRSRTIPPRDETSLMASAIIATGLTVGAAQVRVEPAGSHGVDAAILPDIGAVASVLPELKVVVVRGNRFPILKGKYQLDL